MANTIAHLMVARKILREKPNIVSDQYAYYMGSLAPDAIESKTGATRDDKKLVHLRLGIPDTEWLKPEMMCIFDRRARAFIDEHILNPDISGSQRDFNIGYLVHLLTDRVNHKTVRQAVLRAVTGQGVDDGKFNFFHMVINDLEALDNILLNEHPDIGALFRELLAKPVENALPGYIEKEYIERSIIWWRETYLPSIKERRLKYIEKKDMDDFIEIASAEIEKELEMLLNK